IAWASGESGLSLTTLRTSSSARSRWPVLRSSRASSSFESALGSTATQCRAARAASPQLRFSSATVELLQHLGVRRHLLGRVAQHVQRLDLIALRRKFVRLGDRFFTDGAGLAALRALSLIGDGAVRLFRRAVAAG